MELKELEFKLAGISCADCAAKLVTRLNQLAEIETAELDFATEKLRFSFDSNLREKKIVKQIKRTIKEVEPQVKIKGLKEQEEPKLDLALKKKLARLGLGVVFFLSALFTNLSFELELGLYILAYLIIGNQVLIKFVKNLLKGELFDENFLMAIATMGAFAIREFPEAVAVMLFYEIGESFQQLAVNHSRGSIKSLLDIKAEYANLKEGDKLKQVKPEEVEVGAEIVVKTGEKIPLDGEIIEGEALIDTSALTGESKPKQVKVGDEILSGSINQNGLLTVKVTGDFSQSTVKRILDLVENAASKKAPTEKFITKFARYYTPVVVFLAAILAIVPPIVISGALFSDWFYRALIFLVISCPCALVISIPLGFFGGIGAASRQGVLVKGGNYLEALNNVTTVVMDKTGTLTEGNFVVDQINTIADISDEQLLELAAQVESNSNHPIAQSIRAAYQGQLDQLAVTNYQEIAGCGVKAVIDQAEILVGNAKLMKDNNIKYQKVNQSASIIHLAKDREYLGYISIRDQIKADAKEAVTGLRELGIKNLVMLTGDKKEVAVNLAKKLELDSYQAELLPEQKVIAIEELMEDKAKKDKLIFIGDGINDAPVLARSDIGVAMGALGSDAAIEAADVVLMQDRPSDLVKAINIAKFTNRIVWQNIILALGVKIIVLSLGAFGLASMWGAIFADVGVAILAILNSIRLTYLTNYLN